MGTEDGLHVVETGRDGKYSFSSTYYWSYLLLCNVY